MDLINASRALIVFSALALVAGCASGGTNSKGQYASVNGLRLYYELHGTTNATNTPLVLLHGGGSTIDTSFGKVLPALPMR